MSPTLRVVSLLIMIVFIAACGGGDGAPAPGAVEDDQPDLITVQHVLIGFDKTVPGKTDRTQAEAQTLANSVYEKAKAGENFDELVKEYSDDNYPGVYELANFGVDADKDMLQYNRKEMAKSFGDVAFSLQVNEIGMANYDKSNSKYGWHIILRLE